jgi:hypothetical protein
MAFISFYFWFYVLQFISVFYNSTLTQDRNKNSIKIIIWLVVGYRSGGPGSIPGTTKKKLLGLERGPLSLVTTTEELLDRKVAAPV